MHKVKCCARGGSLQDGPYAVQRGGQSLWEIKAGKLPGAVRHGKYHAVRLPLQPVLDPQFPVQGTDAGIIPAVALTEQPPAQGICWAPGFVTDPVRL